MNIAPQRVIACVVTRGDKLLVCQRPLHKRHGGLWEFPGGKVHPEETDAGAAARELAEELGVQLRAAQDVAFEMADPNSPYLIAFIPVVIDGEPSCREHSDMRWDKPADLLALPLAPADRAFVLSLVGGSGDTSHG